MRAPAADAPLVALTGASGFLGSHIAEALLASGRRVRAALRPTSDTWRIDGLPLERCITELEDPDGLDTLLDGADAIIHCAGLIRSGDPARFASVNTDATRRLLAAAVRAGSAGTFLLISSLAAGGPAPGGRSPVPRTEDMPDRPITAYGLSKLAAEKLLAADLPFRTLALRPPALYGPRDTAFLPLFRAAAHGWSMRAGRIRRLSLLDGRDCAAAAVGLLETPTAEGVYYVEDGHGPYTFDDMAAALGRAFGRRVRVVPLPLGLLKAAAALLGRHAADLPLISPDRLLDCSVTGWLCDGARLRHVLTSHDHRSLDTGFIETLSYYKSTEWLDRAKI